MARFTPGSLTAKAALIGALLLGGCGLLPEQVDETAGWNAQKLYSEAKASMSEGGYERAVTLFEKLEARYPFIKLHPNHPNVDYAYYLKGLVNFNEDLGLLAGLSRQDLSERDPKGAREAFDSFRELVERFPASRYAEDSRARMQYLINSLASHEVHVSRYYYNRGAYVAAINRAQTAVSNFPQAPAIEEALFLMVMSYDKLGMAQLRDDADRVMRKNFPDSVYFRGGPEDDRPWWQLW